MQKIASLLLLIIVTIIARAQSPEETLNYQLDSIAAQEGLVGFGVSVFSPEEVLFQNGYGYADKEHKKPYTSSTIQNIGSISKTFIGVSLMKAVELGQLQIDTEVNDILPFKVVHPKYPEIPITVRHLATHTSGIYDWGKGYDKSYVLEDPEQIQPQLYNKEIAKYIESIQENKGMALGDYLEKYLTPNGAFYHKKNFLKTAPGAQYEYSNIASALAAHCIEVTSGMSFAAFTQQYIFDKIGMKDTGWSFDAIEREKHAKVYTKEKIALPAYSLITYPDGGLRTSIGSLTQYMQAMIRGYEGDNTIVKSSLIQEMMTGQVTKEQYGPTEDLDDNYGFFWESNKPGILGHNGGDPGIFTMMYYYKEKGIGVIFFTNTNMIDNPSVAKHVQACWNAIKTYQKEKFKNRKS